jgi:hypothetical protein
MLSEWREITSSVKVQPSFNNRKQRKAFEARMAHSTVVYGNYLVVFGGYSPQENQFMHANLNILSLTGCTDYMLERVNTIRMAYEGMLHQKSVRKESLKAKSLSRDAKLPRRDQSIGSKDFKSKCSSQKD